MNFSEVARLRMFAGPNGSGKSTAKAMLRPELLKFYLNADDIEATIRSVGFFDFANWQLAVEGSEFRDFLVHSTLLAKANLLEQAAELTFKENKIFFLNVEVNSYFASVIADFVRHRFIELGRSFTFETVMSSPDKIEFLQNARKAGFRTYLYFVATQDADINVARVANRVRAGGHDVPHDKIIARYHRSLGLLANAINAADRAYIFDNSSTRLDFIAEFENGRLTALKNKTPPRWFEIHVLDKLN